jgi:hypothetical protein
MAPRSGPAFAACQPDFPIPGLQSNPRPRRVIGVNGLNLYQILIGRIFGGILNVKARQGR